MVVYCLKQNDTVVYVGSTQYFPARLNTYKQEFYGGTKNTRLFKFWRPLGWEALKFEMLDDLDNKLSLEDRLTLEGEYIAKFDAPLNTFRNPIRKEKPSHYVMEWARKNPEKRAAQKKKDFAKWYAKNADKHNKQKRDNRALKNWLLEFKDI
jgi:hypothetical protein